MVKIKKAAAALLKQRDKMPLSRIQELENIIKAHLNMDAIEEEQLQELIDIKTLVKTSDYLSHGEGVVNQIKDYQEFVEMWRNHFLETMKPKHLHKSWSINRNRQEFGEEKEA